MIDERDGQKLAPPAHDIEVHPGRRDRFRWYLRIDGTRVAQSISPNGFKDRVDALVDAQKVIQTIEQEAREAGERKAQKRLASHQQELVDDWKGAVRIARALLVLGIGLCAVGGVLVVVEAF